MKLSSSINRNSDDYSNNRDALLSSIEEVESVAEEISLGGNERARERHLSRGKLLPRERISRLIDPGSAFLEIGLFAAWNHYGNEVPSAGVIAGVAPVCGIDCVIICNDATVKGGTYFPLTVKKHLRAQAIAEQNQLPCIYLVPESVTLYGE